MIHGGNCPAGDTLVALSPKNKTTVPSGMHGVERISRMTLRKRRRKTHRKRGGRVKRAAASLGAYGDDSPRIRELRRRGAAAAGRETTDIPAFARKALAVLPPLRPILPHALGHRFAGCRAHLFPAALLGRFAGSSRHGGASGLAPTTLRLCFHNRDCPIQAVSLCFKNCKYIGHNVDANIVLT